jgi:hypothetical protein
MATAVQSASAKAIATANATFALALGVPVLVLAANASRCSFLLSNEGPGNVWLTYGPVAAPHSGAYAKPGAAICDDQWAGPVSAVADAASIVCLIEKSYAVGDDQGEQLAGAQSFIPSGPSDTPIRAPSSDITGNADSARLARYPN